MRKKHSTRSHLDLKRSFLQYCVSSHLTFPECVCGAGEQGSRGGAGEDWGEGREDDLKTSGICNYTEAKILHFYYTHWSMEVQLSQNSSSRWRTTSEDPKSAPWLASSVYLGQTSSVYRTTHLPCWCLLVHSQNSRKEQDTRSGKKKCSLK